MLCCAVLLHIAAWNSEKFCDWYIRHIYGIWVNTYGRAVDMVPFSVGELLITFCLLLTIVTILSVPARLICRRAGKEDLERSDRFCKFCCRVSAWVLLGAFVLMTLNCYILYHASGFAGEYLAAGKSDYTLDELAALRNFVAEQCNVLCCQIPRNEDGSISYQGDMIGTAKAAMKHLGETYGELSGFYPGPKPLRSSDFMSQQYIAGCFFPFSMEAGYNDVMYVMNLPSALCHELGHLKGYVQEDEANLIAYLACVQSEDIYFRYSGYLSVLNYVDKDFGQSLDQVQIQPQVQADNVFLTKETWTRIEREALLDTEAVDAISDSIADASLKFNGVEDGMLSYSKVVELLLRYYDIYGYPLEDFVQ